MEANQQPVERLVRLVERLRDEPAAIADTKALAAAIEVGAAALADLVRHAYHRSPAELLERLRIARARHLLIEGDRGAAEIAAQVGFRTPAVFASSLRRATCLSPAAYRGLRGARTFALRLPVWLSIAPLLRYWGRDPRSLTEQVEGRQLRLAMTLGGVPALLVVRIDGRMAHCALRSRRRLGETAAAEAHAVLVRLFGLDRDPRPFERSADSEPRLGRLVAAQRGLVVPQTRDLFEALLWVIAGQQVSLAAAFAMRRRLIAGTGVAVGDGLLAPPAPAAVAALSVDAVRAMGFSLRKAEVVLAAAADAAGGRLDTDVDFAVAPCVEQTLLARRGFGPWSAGYLMMRAWGFADCVPVGDAALRRRLAEVYGLDERPDGEQTHRLMAPFAPHRSLATFHFWASGAGAQ